MQKRKYIILGSILAITILIVPFLIVSFFTLPYSDDFMTAADMHINSAENSLYFNKAIKATINYYKNWGGFYFATFMNIFLSPFARWGLNGMRIVIFLFQILHYIALYALVYEVVYSIYKSKKQEDILPIYTMVIFTYNNLGIQNEVLTWYTGVVAYVFVVTCMLFGTAFFFRGIRTQKKLAFICATVLFFLASGGALNIVVLNCGVAILAGALGIWIYKEKKSWGIIGGAFVGGIINAIAPGNFVRHSAITEHYYVGEAVKGALYHVWERWQELMLKTPWMLILLFMFFWALYITKPSDKFAFKKPALIIALYFVACVMVDFPVYLGYSNYYPGRCAWVEDCCIYLGAFVVVFYLAGWMKTHGYELRLNREVAWCISISCILFMCSLGGTKSFDDYPTVQLIKQLTNGEIKDFTGYWEDILNEIENSDDSDVEIDRVQREKNQFIKDPDIYGTKEDYTNTVVAAYYNKESVIIKYHN